MNLWKIGLILGIGSFVLIIILGVVTGEFDEDRVRGQSLKVGETTILTHGLDVETINGHYVVTDVTGEVAGAGLSAGSVSVSPTAGKPWGEEITASIKTYAGVPLEDGQSKLTVAFAVRVPDDPALVGKTGTLQVRGTARYPHESAFDENIFVESERPFTANHTFTIVSASSANAPWWMGVLGLGVLLGGAIFVIGLLVALGQSASRPPAQPRRIPVTGDA